MSYLTRPRWIVLPALLVAMAAALPALPSSADAQIWSKVKQKAKARIDQRVDQGIDKSLDAVECVATDSACIEKAKAEGRQVKVKEGDAASGAEATPAGEPATVWVNYDFVPGTKVLFAEDFSRDQVGDFPQRLDLKRGNLEVAERNGVRWLRATSPGEVLIPLPAVLPQRFTLEFDYIGPPNEHQFVYFSDAGPVYALFRAGNSGGEGGLEAPGGVHLVSTAPAARPGTVVPVRIMADGEHVKVYLGATRVANGPRIRLGRDRTIRLQLNAGADKQVFVGNIRVAEGGKPLYDAIAASGRVATQGILFDTGSDRIRPESTPTLTEIARMMKEHDGLQLLIEGHTDDVGDAKANLDLSQRRADAVRAALVDRFGVAGSRLATKGLGETKPAADNRTAEGRQQNRRVELVKQ